MNNDFIPRNSFFLKKSEGVVDLKNLFNWLNNRFGLLSNGSYEIIIRKAKVKRTTSQNSMMWLWFQCIAMETGNTKEDIHDYYCGKYLKREIEVNGEIVDVIGGTSRLDTVVMTNFLNNVQADAASELGITLPTPDDLHWKEFEDIYKRYIY
jgi:hypothetical protein